MNAVRHGTIALVLLAAAACTGSDAPKLQETIGSHAATARLLAGELDARHVSRRYAALLARRLAEALDQQAKAAEQAKLSSGEQRRVSVALWEARREVARAAAAAEAP